MYCQTAIFNFTRPWQIFNTLFHWRKFIISYYNSEEMTKITLLWWWEIQIHMYNKYTKQTHQQYRWDKGLTTSLSKLLSRIKFTLFQKPINFIFPWKCNIVERTECTYPEFSAKYEPHVSPETQEVFVGVLYSVFKNEAVNICKGTALNGLVVNLCPMYR